MALGRTKSHQLNLLTDRYLNLPDKMRRYVDESWAPEFYDQVTCMINQDRFEVLFSENKATRPSTPIDQIVGALKRKCLIPLVMKPGKCGTHIK